ncbi:universal stress protein [Haloplanus pelagicus]|jgi:nucleotide-binding universal stress UspA family protein|uniref:universal stress protein n=1 Tax=Haloplanus pelagicus TaxID=2949995 RepID=UPI00203B425C|nr:universal stress protein [Haloplanus sp. HW8-1]
MYDDILIPTDGSDPAAAAFDHALDLAERFDATVHVLYVVETDSLSHEAPALAIEDLRETLRSEGEAILDDLCERATARGVAVTEAIVEGVPEDAILEYVADGGVDLLVMGTHGRHGLERYLVGSVTERVVRRADVPVLVVGEG